MRSKFLSTGALALALALSPTLASPALADQPAPAVQPGNSTENTQKTVLTKEHTDALAFALKGNKLDMFTYADLPGAPRTHLDPANTIFNLVNNEKTRVAAPGGFEFIAPAGQEIWLAPQTQVQGAIWPGWNTEDIRPGALKDDAVTIELLDTKTPQGASVEVFQASPFGVNRVFSSDEKLAPLVQPVASHVHANWAFTATGTYELTFRASATLATGEQVQADQTYTFVVGALPQENPQATPSASATPEPSALPTLEPTLTPTSAATPSESASKTPAPAPTNAETSLPAAENAEHPAPAAEVAAPTPDTPASETPAPQGSTSQQPDQQAEAPAAPPAAPAPIAPAPQQKNNLAAPQAPAPAPLEQCLATEEVVKAAQAKTTANRAAHAPASFTIQRATNPNADRALEGHFDFGAVLSGGQLTAKLKDDRTSPAVWKQTGALTFVLGDKASMKLPAGMEHIAPAGTQVYLIGATQQGGVPWLGWNTQNPELVAEAAGDATMTLKSVSGPGKLSVFLSGNFGAAGTPVFNSAGDSFKVPMNTHQHGNWVFTEAGNYSATIEWSVPLKDGSVKVAEGTLSFTVGDAPAQQDGGSSAADQQPGAPAQDQQKPADTKGSVDIATGLVTKPDGSQVRIVGKTASGKDCNLPAGELKEAQQAAAEGRLAYTGSSTSVFMVGGLATLAVGATLLLLARKRRLA